VAAGSLSAIATVVVWLFSLPRFRIVPDVFGYTPAWMFVLLLAAVVIGVFASIGRRIWWFAVLAAAFSLVLMLTQNNS
jgi:hypothetical protein